MTGWMAQGRLDGLAGADRGARHRGRGRRADRRRRAAWPGPTGAAVAGAVPPYAIPNVAVDHVRGRHRHRDRPVARRGAQLHLLFHRMLHRRARPRRRAASRSPSACSCSANNPRLARCLATAASIGGWDGGPPGSGMGLACHSAFGSHIACLVEVEVTGEQRLRVLRAVARGRLRAGGQSRDRQAADRGRHRPRRRRRDRPADRLRRRPARRARSIGAYGLPILRDAPDVTRRAASRATRRRAASPSSACRPPRPPSPTPISR